MVTITLNVGGGNTTITVIPDDATIIHTRTRGLVRADEIQVGDVIPDYPGSQGACAVSVVEVS